MSKLNVVLVALVAAIPGIVLAALIIMAFLGDSADNMGGVVMGLAAATLAVSAFAAVLPAGIFLFSGKERAAEAGVAEPVEADEAVAADESGEFDVDAGDEFEVDEAGFAEAETEDEVAFTEDDFGIDEDEDYDMGEVEMADADFDQSFEEDEIDFDFDDDERN